MKKVYKAICVVVCVILMLTGSYVRSFCEGSVSWYCKRNKDHKQPIIDEQLKFVERYDGYYVDRKHGDDSDQKVVYLTFDAGYENGNIEKILDILKAEEVKGAFFILGNLVTKNTDLVLRMGNEGHLVCNHTRTHKDVSMINNKKEFEKELRSLEELYREYTGRELHKYFRPPEGRISEMSISFAKEMGYKTVFWSFAYADWDNNKQPSPEYAKNKIIENIHNGAIILLHPTSATNALILKDVIRTLKAEGYCFGTLDELTK